MIEIEDDQKEPGTIVQEIQKGFMMKDRLLRPSLVGVSKKKAEKVTIKEEKNQEIDEKQSKNNIKTIESLNKKLDPNFHQAMMEIEDDSREPGTIVQEIQKGFTIKHRLLRPSLVGVSKKTTKKDEKSEENKENLDK